MADIFPCFIRLLCVVVSYGVDECETGIRKVSCQKNMREAEMSKRRQRRKWNRKGERFESAGLVLIMGDSRVRRKPHPFGRQHCAFRNWNQKKELLKTQIITEIVAMDREMNDFAVMLMVERWNLILGKPQDELHHQ